MTLERWLARAVEMGLTREQAMELLIRYPNQRGAGRRKSVPFAQVAAEQGWTRGTWLASGKWGPTLSRIVRITDAELHLCTDYGNHRVVTTVPIDVRVAPPPSGAHGDAEGEIQDGEAAE